MIAVISPAKTLDFESPSPTSTHTTPEFLDRSEKLVAKLRRLPQAKLGALMSISDNLAALNRQRFMDWQLPFTTENAKQALMAFKGDVYTGFELEKFKETDFAYAQEHLRILSGLYGLLRPLDLIQPYRLEMGTKFGAERAKDLYEYWRPTVTDALKAALAQSGGDVLINLASNEYFSAVDKRRLSAGIVTPVFKDLKNGRYKVISFFAKKARGAMSDYLIRKRINEPGALKKFKGLGYRYDRAQSTENEWVFTRDEPTTAP